MDKKTLKELTNLTKNMKTKIPKRKYYIYTQWTYSTLKTEVTREKYLEFLQQNDFSRFLKEITVEEFFELPPMVA